MEQSNRGAAMPAPQASQAPEVKSPASEQSFSHVTPQASLNPQLVNPTPKYDNGDEDAKPKQVKGIPVVATAHGFYGNVRRAPGDKFTIESEQHIGLWMQKI